MTKTNEPQDILQDILNESVAEQSQDGEVGKPSETTEAASDDSKVWMDVGGADSVEEAFLALIESNKPQESETAEEEVMKPAETLESVAGQVEAPVSVAEENVEPPIVEEPVEVTSIEEQQEAPSGIVSDAPGHFTEADVEALFSVDPSEFSMEPADVGKTMEPETFVHTQDTPVDQPFDAMGLQPTLVETQPLEIPDIPNDIASEQALTDALSETIAESLAEIQAGQTVEQADEALGIIESDEQVSPEPAFLPEQEIVASEQPTMLPEQSVSLPEFSEIPPIPLENFPAQVTETVPLPNEFVADTPKPGVMETKQAPSVNEVMNQHHTLSNPIEIGEQQVSPTVGQMQAGGFNPEINEAVPVPQTGTPIAVDMASRDEPKKTNVDPEFQALVQWSNSDVEPSHHGPHDIPNFLSQKREEETGFNFRSVFVAIGISAIVVGMFSVGYQMGSTKTPPIDRTAINIDGQKPIILEENEADITGLQRASAEPASILEFSVANLNGVSGKAVPMDIKLEGENLGSETTLLFRGIPDGIKLSKGAQRDGFWTVRKSDLNKLALHVPEDYRGKFNFEVFAFKDKESGPERRLASVNIESLRSGSRVDSTPINIIDGEKPVARNIPTKIENQLTPGGVNTASTTELPPVEQRNEPKGPPISAQVEASMLQRANRLLKNGDISGARLIFEHVAIQGSKHAAFALARTYDEDFLEQLFIRGMVPQMDTAVKWYKKAASMGHKDAVRRLDQLGFR